jgi:hypothetical protein
MVHFIAGVGISNRQREPSQPDWLTLLRLADLVISPANAVNQRKDDITSFVPIDVLPRALDPNLVIRS